VWRGPRHALAQDDEMIFSIPKSKLEDLMLGLRYLDEEVEATLDSHPI